MYRGFSWCCKAGAVVLLSVVFTLNGISSSNAEISPDERTILSAIRVDRVMRTINRLCGDEFGGRRAGSPEHYAAADYLASRFAELGLDTVPGVRGYKQALTMKYALIRSKDDIKATLSYTVPGLGGALRKRSFAYRSYNGNGGLKIHSEVIFVGYGIHDPAAEYDDYAALDVAGKIVLWLPGRPRGVRLSGPVTTAHKTLAAYRQGAAACLQYRDAGHEDYSGANVGLSGSITDFPLLAVDAEVADELLLPTGLSVGRLLRVDASELPRGATGVLADLSVTPVRDPSRLTYNVLAMLPGTDAEVADEVVMLGAHYDHIGDTGAGEICRGADDNASGTAVLLEVATALRQADLQPRRSIVVAAWTAEEAGLGGSKYFTANPPFPLDRVKSNIVLDMVGVGAPGAFRATGTAAYPEQYRTLASSASDIGITLRPDTARGASDHLPFARERVPSSLVHADGEHPYLHSVRDGPDRLDRTVLLDAARFAALAVWRTASQ